MKWIIRLVGFLIVLVVVLAVSVLFLPADKIARIATDQLRTITGRDVSIRGDVSLTFWPVLGVRASDLEVGNADWTDQGPMLEAANAAIGVDAMSLLRGHIRITNIEAESPVIRLDQRLDGRASWQFTDASGGAQIETTTEPQREARTISIARLSVTNATLIYDAEGSDLVALEGVDLNLDWPERLGPAEIEARLKPAQSVVSASAVIDGFAGFIVGDVQTLRANVETEAGTVSFDGRASTVGAVAGRLQLNATNTDGFLRALGLPGADLPAKLGRSLRAQTDLTLTPDRKLALREVDVDLGGNRVTGAADIALNGVPQVVAKLNTGAFDLSGLDQGASGAGGNASAPSGWPKNPIDASGLAAFNGDIELNAQSVDLGSFKLGQTRAVLRNENSRMVIELREVAAYDGVVTGEFVLNNRGGLSVGGQMNVRALQMQAVLRDAIGFDRVTGLGNMQLSFLGSGASMHAIMNSLSGKGSLDIGRGTFEGINLDQLLRSGDVGSGTTIFDDLKATWTISGGVLTNRDLSFQLKNYEASGEGTVGLGTQTLDYTFTPVDLRADSGQGLAIPVRFVGPWSNISIRPDVEGALQGKIDEKKEVLEQKAREKLSDKLGVKPSEGQSTEDAVKEKLLRKLFD